MSDREEVYPAHWDSHPAVRHLVLAFAPPPVASALRVVADLVFDAVLADGSAVHDPKAQLLAVSLDLEVASLFLDSCLSDDAGAYGTSSPLRRWRDHLGELASEVRAVAEGDV